MQGAVLEAREYQFTEVAGFVNVGVTRQDEGLDP